MSLTSAFLKLFVIHQNIHVFHKEILVSNSFCRLQAALYTKLADVQGLKNPSKCLGNDKMSSCPPLKSTVNLTPASSKTKMYFIYTKRTQRVAWMVLPTLFGYLSLALKGLPEVE